MTVPPEQLAPSVERRMRLELSDEQAEAVRPLWDHACAHATPSILVGQLLREDWRGDGRFFIAFAIIPNRTAERMRAAFLSAKKKAS